MYERPYTVLLFSYIVFLGTLTIRSNDFELFCLFYYSFSNWQYY